MRYEEMPPVEEIKKWVMNRGLSAFGPDPNPYKKSEKTPQRRINEIAWGFAKKTKSDPKYRRQRKWWSSIFYRNLNALQEQLSINTMDVGLEQMKSELKELLRQGPTNSY